MKRTLEEKLALPYVKLNLGAGLSHHQGELGEWITLDADHSEGLDIQCDWKNIPLPDKCIDEIHSSESIEHVRTYLEDVVFPEWNRVLKIGGVIKGTTPNLAYACRAFARGEKDIEWTLRNLYGDRVSENHTHPRTFTKDTFIATLSKYGFGDFEFENVGSDDPNEWWWLAFSFKKITDCK